jgi:hypothetical protein
VVTAVVDAQHCGEVAIDLDLGATLHQFGPSEVLIPAFRAQRCVQQALRTIGMRQSLRILALRLDDLADDSKASGVRPRHIRSSLPGDENASVARL